MILLRKYSRYLSIIVASLVFLFYANAKVGPVAKQAKGQLSTANTTLDTFIKDVVGDVERYGSPANVAIVERRARRNVLNELVLSHAGELEFQLSSDFNIDALGADADSMQKTDFYFERLDAVEKRLRYTRFWKPIIKEREGVPATVGFDFRNDKAVGGTTLNQKLLRLDMLRRVARSAENTGVNKVIDFVFMTPGSLNKLEERLPSAALNASHSRGGGTVIPPLRTIGIEVNAKGDPFALLAFLTDLQQPEVDGQVGRGFAIENFSLNKEDWKEPEDQLVNLHVVLVAFSVASETDLPEKSLKVAFERFDRLHPAGDMPGGQPDGPDINKPDPDDPFGAGTLEPRRTTGRRRR